MNDTGCKFVIRREKITTSTTNTQIINLKIKIVHRRLVLSDPSIPVKIYNVAGQELMQNQILPTGVIIVVTPNQAYKIAVR